MGFRLVTANLNGIRSATTKGLEKWLVSHAPDVLCVQEVKAQAPDVEGKFVRQSGGKGQYGHAVIVAEPGEKGSGYVFVDKIVGGSVPREFIKPINEGIREALQTGIYAGFPGVDVTVTLVDGSYHDVDSSEMAFKIAGSMALKDAFPKPAPAVLEPVMNVEVVSPETYMGDVLGDISSRRGRIGGMTLKPSAAPEANQSPIRSAICSGVPAVV